MSSIILVEEEQDLRTLIEEILVMAGYEVRTFDKAGCTWEYICQHGFDADLLITDVELAGEPTGLQLIHKLHLLLPEVPVVLTSAYGRELTYLDPQVFRLPKPYSIDQLEAICLKLTSND